MSKNPNHFQVGNEGHGAFPGFSPIPSLRGMVGKMEYMRLSVSGLLLPPKDFLNHGKKAKTILLVPGFLGTNASMSVLGEHLAERVNIAYAPEFGNFNSGSLLHSGKSLAQRIRELLDTDGLSRDITVLGYSNGGLIAFAALRSDTKLKVNELVTMGTPFLGTPLAYPLSFLSPACYEVNTQWRMEAGYDYSGQVKKEIIAHVSHQDSLVPPRSQFPGHSIAPGKVRRVDHPDHTHTCFVIGSGVKRTADAILRVEKK